MIITEPVFYRAGSLHDGRLQRLNEVMLLKSASKKAYRFAAFLHQLALPILCQILAL